jgi:hypothetical protein
MGDVMMINFAGAQVITGDAAAQALLDFASVLAKLQTTDEVQLNTVQANGEPGVSRFLLGPASQIVISSHTSMIEEPDNAEVVASIRQRMRDLAGYEVASEPGGAGFQENHL